jgi:hypothetical protein
VVSYILKGVHCVGSLLDFSSNDFRNQLLHEIFQSSATGLFVHDLHHSLTNVSYLRRLCISRLLDLIWASFSEGDDENSNEVAVGGFNVGMGFDKSLPLSNERSEFVTGEVHSRKVGETVFALHFIDTEFDLSESVLFIVLEVCERDFEDTSLESIIGRF